MIDLQQQLSAERTKTGLGQIHRVLVEGVSKKSTEKLYGRNTQNTTVVFPRENYKPGDYVYVLADECTAATLIGKVVK